ncbi:MAG TPA: hypothetical protein VF278_10920 [Pirellulales bacterium]
MAAAKVVFGINPVLVAVAKKHRRLGKNALRPHTNGTTRSNGRLCRGGAWLALKEGTSSRLGRKTKRWAAIALDAASGFS